MNEKEIGELRRRFRPDKGSISHVRGCYVNDSHEIVGEFNQSLGLMSQEEGEKLLAVLKRTLSGGLGKNLLNLSFATSQVQDSPEHKLLTALRDGDEEAIHIFYEKVKDSLVLEGSYLILLAMDAYDVLFRGKDGQDLEDASENVYRYVLCSVCPVKLSKPALTYVAAENEFHNRTPDWVVGAPELGFLFPAFDDRATNLYGALYYTRSIAESHREFVDAVFRLDAPMPAAAQKETFQAILGEALGEECSLETVQAVRGQICSMIQEHKESKEPEPLTLPKGIVKGVLTTCGVSEDHVEAFSQQYDQAFGADTDLSPRNIVDPKQMEVKTPDVTIRINPERSDLIETRVLGGAKYILIRADEGVEVNGVNIQIED